MEYRIKQQHRLKGVSYLSSSFDNRNEAESELKEIISKNTDTDAVYTVVYGKFYFQGAENGSFAEFKEPTGNDETKK